MGDNETVVSTSIDLMDEDQANMDIEIFEKMLEDCMTASNTSGVPELCHNLHLLYKLKKNPNMKKAAEYKSKALHGEYPPAQYEEGLDLYQQLRCVNTAEWNPVIDLFTKAAMLSPYDLNRDDVFGDGEIRQGVEASSMKILGIIFEDHIKDYDRAEFYFRGSIQFNYKCFDAILECGQFFLRLSNIQPKRREELENEAETLINLALKMYKKKGVKVQLNPQPIEFYDLRIKSAHIALFEHYQGWGLFPRGSPGRMGDLRKCAKHYRAAVQLGYFEKRIPDRACILNHPVVIMRIKAIDLANDPNLSDFDDDDDNDMDDEI